MATSLAPIRFPAFSWAWLKSLSGLTFLLVAASIASASIDIHEGDSTRLGEVGLDKQVLLKLGVALSCCCVGGWGLLTRREVFATLTSLPGILLLLMSGTFFISSLTAISSASFPAATLFFGYLLFIPTALHLLGLQRFLHAVMFGLIAYVALGWVLYIAFPNYGEFVEWAEGGITVSRMGGAAHPNVFSRAALFLVLISTYLYRSGSLPVRYWIPIFLWASVTLYLAMSRAAILTCGVALMMLWWDRLLSVQAILLVMVLGMALTSGLITLVAMGHGDKIQRKLVSMVTKSDDLEEVKSATGRSAIWAEARRLIALRPWFGYGLNSSPLLLVDYNQHTHNILLNPALSAGIPAAVLLGCVLVWNLFHLFGSTNLFVRAICLYVLFSGVVEDTIIETFPATGTVIWLVATLWPVMVAANMVRESEYNGSHASADAVPLGA